MKYRIALALIMLAILSRLLPHPPNFTPIAAVGLFGASVLGRPWLAVAVPFLSLFLSDLYINNVVYGHFSDHFVWFGSLWVYAAFGVVIALGRMLLSHQVNASRVVLASLSASVLFFLLTNFGVWATSGMYPHTTAGLIACYVAGLPFFGNTVLGDLLYSAALFGGYAWVIRYWQRRQQAVDAIKS
ncbi:MAG: DUF6580 family putative transport protein [Saprospiraceae bacterium]|nr:hypothetical protein [Saprospiraceae bacterium]MDW8230084.1 DUF6580 family putative transport protein [Saprospiraceae bacterium]